MTDLAQKITDVSGKSVNYQNLTANEYRQALRQVGLLKGLVEIIVDADEQAEKGALFSKRQDL